MSISLCEAHGSTEVGICPVVTVALGHLGFLPAPSFFSRKMAGGEGVVYKQRKEEGKLRREEIEFTICTS